MFNLVLLFSCSLFSLSSLLRLSTVIWTMSERVQRGFFGG